MSIELHCHTLFSIDAGGTPENLVDVAATNGVSFLSITEHNHLGSCARGAARAATHGITYIPGVELDTTFNNTWCHILGLGIDPANPILQQVVTRNHDTYVHRFRSYYTILRELGFQWTMEDIEEGLPRYYPTHPSPIATFFAVRRFMHEQGCGADFDAYHQTINARLAATERPPEEQFLDFETIFNAIHTAGGVVILAHVGHYFHQDIPAQVNFIRKIIAAGCDGFETHHFRNVAFSNIDTLLELRSELNCLASGGSDCHHAPSSRPLGASGITREIAKPLLERLLPTTATP
ncbi:MAG: PHP domain-containing protein [Lentisphaerae bacterium]|jgi:predicted metal-dependent phosphoesterase TrpH|nr:PHP domain-containing protein [Lentisphaerota bacterium]